VTRRTTRRPCAGHLHGRFDTLQELALTPMDIYSSQKRSQIMASVRSSGTGPELIAKQWLWSRGFRYSRCPSALPGSPDIVLPRWCAVVFVHGCFWHGHCCSRAKLPRTNRGFWEQKTAVNKLRDRRVASRLRRMGWRCFTVWQCSLIAGLERVERSLHHGRNAQPAVRPRRRT
jgi:DNA mismatch endonuclease, patch repair protein